MAASSILFALYGVFQGVFRAIGKAMAADLSPPEVRASGIGWYGAIVGASGLVASLVAGVLWDKVGHAAVFWWAAGFRGGWSRGAVDLGSRQDACGTAMKTLMLMTLALAMPATAAPKPGWKAFAECAAAYEANARIKDPERSAQMAASMQDVADDYRGAAIGLRKPRNDEAVKAYIATRVPFYAAKPRKAVEAFIDKCPAYDR